MIRLALILLLSSAARGGELCGTVTVLGRPLPEGAATLAGDARFGRPGASERSLVRFKDGRFCLGRPKPGDYAVWISPLGLWEPMAARFAGMDSGPETLRMSVADDGRIELYDASGTLKRRARELDLEYAPPKEESDWARLSVSLEFEGSPAPRSPVLVLLHMQFLGYSFAWIDPASPRVELAVKPWKLVDAIVSSPGWAVAGTEPQFHQLYSDSISFKAAQSRPFALKLRRSAVVEGRVRRPDGAAFKPDLGGDKSKRVLFGFFVTNLDGTQEFHSYVDESGYFRFEAPEGLWQVQPLLEHADGYSIRTGPQTLEWLKPGDSRRMDYSLPALAGFRVDHASVPVGTFWEQDYSLYPRRDHWILAFPTGRLAPEDSYQFVNREEAVFALGQRPDGRWRISEDSPETHGGDERLTVAAGDYDLYLVESDRVAPPSSKVLAVKRAAKVAAGTDYALAFSKTEMYPAGRAELGGTIKAAMKLTWDEVLKTDSVRRFQLALAPHVNLYDEGGRFMGVAFTDISQPQFNAVFSAIARRDLDGVRSVLYAGARPYKIAGLKPGRYRAEAVAHGYAPISRWIEVKDGEPARLDVDFDK